MKEPNKDLLYALPEELSTPPRTPRLPQTKRPDAQKGHMKSLVFTVRLPAIWEFPKIRGTLFWVLIIRILLFRVLYWGPPIIGNSHMVRALK